MGSLILCHNKKAKQPYEITRIHIRIYTIEELCYYICNNLYLIDYTIMNTQLCDWIEQELELRALAERLRQEITQNCSVEQFVLTILKESTIYSQSDINKIQSILEHLQNQNKADSLLKSGEYASAILVYQAIVSKEWDDSLDKAFYGRVYGSLGTAYGRLFLYEEAARMYQEAYRLCEEPQMLKAYIYSCYRGMPDEQFVKMMSGNPAYLSTASLLKEDVKRIRREINMEISIEQLDQGKKEYRRIDKNHGIC